MDAATNQVDVRVQASGGSVGSNFTSNLSFYGSNFYFNGSVNTLTNSITCGGLTINDTSYGNTKMTIAISNVNTAAYSFSQDYIFIGIGGYDGAVNIGIVGGGIQQNVGGFVTLNTFNTTGNTKVLRCFWNGSILATELFLSYFRSSYIYRFYHSDTYCSFIIYFSYTDWVYTCVYLQTS